MKHGKKISALGVVLAVVWSAGIAIADVTKPGEVKFDDTQVKLPLTGAAGDAAAGKKWFASRKMGNCLACHVNKDLAEQPFHGEIGPPLDGVAERYTAPELRGILINSKIALSDETIMPGFYQTTAGARIAEKFIGKTILSAQQIEDILAYLQTLKE